MDTKYRFGYLKKMVRAMLIIVQFYVVAACNAQTKVKPTALDGQWKLELKHNDIGRATTIINFETYGKNFEAYTRKDADKALLGGWTSMLGRSFTGDFKNGSLLRIEKGIYEMRGDTLWFAGILRSAMGSFNVNGHVAAGKFKASLSTKSKGVTGSLSGIKNPSPGPVANYAAVLKQALSVTKNHIYNRQLLETDQWHEFEKEMQKVAPKIQDDLEMIFAFYYHVGKLPVSHFALVKMPDEPKDESKTVPKRVIVTEKSPNTAYMKIGAFDGSATEIDSAFNLVRKKNYSNLIVDLRDNPGGSIEAGMAFAKNIADTTFYGGIFLTQKYFLTHSKLPSPDEYQNFPDFTEANYSLLIDGIHKAPGLCLKVIPRTVTYKGKIYILTSSGTASTCEPIIYGFKHRNRVTVVGETTAGAMLNGEAFPLSGGFSIVVPTADYYAVDGFRIDQAGVSPDIKVDAKDALEYVLRRLIR